MPDFLLNVAATTIGVLLAFALNYLLLNWSRRQESQRKNDLLINNLQVVSEAVIENQSALGMMREAFEGGGAMPIAAFNLGTWRSVEKSLATDLSDAFLFGHVSRYFSRLLTLSRMAERYWELTYPTNGAAPQLGPETMDTYRRLILEHVSRLDDASRDLLVWLAELRTHHAPPRHERRLKPVELGYEVEESSGT